MKFQNKKNTTAIWLNKFILTLVFTMLIIAVGFIRLFDSPVLGLERTYWIIFLIILWFVIAFIQNTRQPCYIYFEDSKDRIIIRYHPLRIINQKKIALEINKTDFVRYESEKFFWGRYEKLIIYQKFRNRVARYPAISLSAVDKKDIERIKGILGKYVG
jgi:hypothetical protein